MDKDGTLSKDEMTAVIKEMNESLSDEDISEIWDKLDTDKSGSIDKKEFVDWYKSSPESKQRLEQLQDEETDEGIELCPLPDTFGAKIKYFIVLPLVGLMCVTMPDVRKQGNEKYFVWTFFMAIVWCAQLVLFLFFIWLPSA